MTPASSDFISPLVVATLSPNPVAIEFWNKQTGVWTNHIELALWADVFVIAPATANSIAKMANGLCDNLLLATYLSMKTETIICPAMDLDMYQHPSFKRNIATLLSDGILVIPATKGELASGLEGEGRMEEPEVIADYLSNYFIAETTKSTETVLITAGPTYEAIDPVRFIGNHSSGKMGFALAESCLKRGMNVILVSGPTQLELHHPNLEFIEVKSAEQMFNAVSSKWDKCSIGIFAAAVADYRPVNQEAQKIKKKEETLTLELVKNPDILSWASENRNNAQKVIGFALETNNAEENALLKLKSKNLDMIVLNTLENKGAGFQGDTNKITILDKTNSKKEFELKSKTAVAEDIIESILNLK
jgi:phosphopantothenoylcysteine decarboxylase/phosphopantothenate--cysteine ligase